MAVTDLGARRAQETPPDRGVAATETTALESEFRAMREEFAQLRELIAEREKKGRTLINAYRDIIGELTDLFEAERNENIKREESLRFFLASIEKRLKEDIRAELGGGTRDNAGKGRGIWPFRRRR